MSGKLEGKYIGKKLAKVRNWSRYKVNPSPKAALRVAPEEFKVIEPAQPPDYLLETIAVRTAGLENT